MLPIFQPMPVGRSPRPFSRPDWFFEIKWEAFARWHTSNMVVYGDVVTDEMRQAHSKVVRMVLPRA
jgi:hypothetical protein